MNIRSRLLRRIGRPADKMIRKLGYVRPADKPPFESDIFGHKMYVSPSDEGINLHGLGGHTLSDYKHGEISIANHLPPGGTVVDCGANIGFFTLLFARAVGETGRVIAIEPGPSSFALLTKNVAINGYRNVTLINKAISNRSGTTDFFLCRTGESDNTMYATPGEVRDRISVETITLDDLIGDTKVDFVKMDIQGSEYLALLGMAKILRNNPGVRILLEYAPVSLELAGVAPLELISLVSSLGFQTSVVYEGSPAAKVDVAFLRENCGRGKRYPHLNLLLER